MQTIPELYKQAGHAMRLQRREGNVAMYKAAGADYWEVHVVKVEKAGRIFAKEYPERETLSGSAEFGQRGWACTSQERADGRFADALLGCGREAGVEEA
jgi:hypothetical protein